MSEKIVSNKNFEQKYTETEQKFLPLHPEKLDRFRLGAKAIRQIYLSHPDEHYTLRLRKSAKNGDTSYLATLKDRGVMTPGGLRRLEVEGAVSAEIYDYYNQNVPVVRKLRAEPHPNIVIDFFEDGHIHAESENPADWQQFIAMHGFEDDFVDATGANYLDNEWRAHAASPHSESLRPAPDLDEATVTDEIIAKFQQKGSRLIVPIAGRSGSGKSTLVHKLEQRLQDRGITTSVTSTDDYNIGTTRLRELGGGKWVNYDSIEVYDMELCERHIGRLALGLTIPNLAFDFVTGESVVSGETASADVNFVEGIKAFHPDIRKYADLQYTVPASLSRSIGQRIMRDLDERPRFNPSENLSYYLEYAEPEYRALL